MNAVIYARYSSYNQTERSIEGQIEDCMRYAEAHKVNVIGQYIDRARSGTSADTRPEFQEMIKDAEKREFEAVLVYKLDRFARNRYDSAVYKNKLKKFGVRVISATENISEDPEGVILEAMLEGLAEYYSKNLSQNVRRGMKIAREHGTFTGGRLPYGFGLDGKKVIIDEKEGEAIRYAFEQYAAGKRMVEIIDYLNSRGYKPRNGPRFTPKSFQNAFRNRKYVGEYTFADEDIPAAYPRIIDDATFQAVQDRLAQVRHAPGAKKAKVDYLLQGKLFCGHCGANMVGESGRSKGGSVYNYYTCSNRKKHHTCKKRNEKKEFIERYVVDETLKYVLSPECLEYIAEKLVWLSEQDFGNATADLQKKLDKVDREIRDIMDLMIQNTGRPAVTQLLSDRVEILTQEKSDIELDIARKKAASLRDRLTVDECREWFKMVVSGDPADDEYRRKIVEIFINAVYVFDDKVIIYYNIQQTKRVTFEEMLKDLDDPPDIHSCSDYGAISPPIAILDEHLTRLRGRTFGITIERREGV